MTGGLESKASSPGSLAAARDALPLFARLVGFPMTDWQADAFRLAQRYTVLRAPRQTGKSRCLAVTAAWGALRKPGQVVLIVSASEVGARRLLGTVRDVLASPVLRADVVDEQAGSVTLANGSRILALPASERAVRGWSADLLLGDEMAFVSDELIHGAILPTTLARPEARIVFASTPWTASGSFFDFCRLGESGSDPEVRAWRWSVEDAQWVSPGEVERMRATMSPARFACEVQGDWAEGTAGFFSRRSLLGATADYVMTPPEQARGGAVSIGLDFGRAQDFHAAVFLGLADDGGLNPRAPLFVPFMAVSQERYLAWTRRIVEWTHQWSRNPVLRRPAIQVYEGEAIRAVGRPVLGSGYNVVRIVAERNGVGQSSVEFLEDALGTEMVDGVTTTQIHKEVGFSRIASWLGDGLLVLPHSERLLTELTGLEAIETQHGGLSIHAAGSGHDDLAMALCQAAHSIRPDAMWSRPSWDVATADDLDLVEAPDGIRVPRVPTPVRFGGVRRRDLLIVE
ncbi:MAG: terminase large subunit domain-containing protein [Actinomycetota bacterium]